MAKTRPRRGSPLHLTPAFELFKPSKDLVLKNIWIFGPLYAVFVVFSIHTWIWTPAGPGEQHHWWQTNLVSTPSGPWPASFDYTFVGFSIFWFLISAVLGTIVQIMTQKAQFEVAQGKTPTFDRLWATVKELGWRMLGLYIVASLIVIIGFILLIIPGVYMVKRYFLAPYVMLEHKVGIREALDKSAELSPNLGAIWGVVLVGILFSLVSIIPIVGWLVAFALSILYSVAPALRYQELKKVSS